MLYEGGLVQYLVVNDNATALFVLLAYSVAYPRHQLTALHQKTDFFKNWT